MRGYGVRDHSLSFYALLIAASYDDALCSGLARYHIHARCLFEHERHAAYCCLCVLLDLGLSLGCAVPMAEEESAILDALLELLVVVALVDVGITIVESLLEYVVLNVVEQFLNIFGNSFNRT